MISVRQAEFGEWPAHGLERVPCCPLCGGADRFVLHAGLRDHAFRCAPGEWVLQRCVGCGCAYLDPRPDAATIALAYARYYTHESPSPRRGRFAALRRRVAEAYLNARFGMSYPEALVGGRLIAALFPRKRAYLDVTYGRHLGPASGGNTRLLDVGCGNGEFLRFAAHLGWAAEGIDVDAEAVAAARASGCSVTHGGLGELPFRLASYRHVTLSHVIEHVPDPVKLLRQCLALLEPGGRLWLQTPNLRSVGHAVFGPAWRGLEPPRHLVLFDRRSLASALAAAGFGALEFRDHPGVTTFIWEESRRIARMSRHRPRFGQRLLALPPGALVAEYWSVLRVESSEFLTCIAFRPREASREAT